jgi:hypothetical protein
MRTQDSLLHSKDSAYLLAKGYIRIVRDTIGLESEDDTEALEKLKKDANKKPLPVPDSTRKAPDALLPGESNKTTNNKDSVRTEGGM